MGYRTPFKVPAMPALPELIIKSRGSYIITDNDQQLEATVFRSEKFQVRQYTFDTRLDIDTLWQHYRQTYVVLEMGEKEILLNALQPTVLPMVECRHRLGRLFQLLPFLDHERHPFYNLSHNRVAYPSLDFSTYRFGHFFECPFNLYSLFHEFGHAHIHTGTTPEYQRYILKLRKQGRHYDSNFNQAEYEKHVISEEHKCHDFAEGLIERFSAMGMSLFDKTELETLKTIRRRLMNTYLS